MGLFFVASGTVFEDERALMNEPEDRLLTTSEVAAMFAVSPKTVVRWAQDGKLHPIRTVGGRRRFKASEIRRVLEAGTEEHR